MLLVLTRPLGWLWLALAAGFIVAFHGGRVVVELLRARAALVVAAAIAVAGLLQAAYLIGFGLLSVSEPGKAFVGSDDQLTRTVVGHGPALVQQMIGVFGWLDTSAPAYTLFVWSFAFGAVALLAVMLASCRRLFAFVGLAIAVWLVPVVLEFRAARSVGIFWQGRYTLPLACGLIAMVAIVVGERLGARHMSHRVRVAFVGVFVTAQFAAFYWNLRRYTVGVGGAILPWHTAWSPPLTAFPLLLVELAALSAFAIVTTSAPKAVPAVPRAEQVEDPPAPAAVAELT